MMKRLALVLVLALMPGAAMAQQHEHSKQAMTAKTEHMNFARELIAAKADLQLTDEQVTKLQALAVKMDEMHAKMAEGHQGMAKHAADGAAKPADAAKPAEAAKPADATKPADAAHAGDMGAKEGKMHADLLAIFTEEQLVKVRPMMKAHMEKMMGPKKAEQHKH